MITPYQTSRNNYENIHISNLEQLFREQNYRPTVLLHIINVLWIGNKINFDFNLSNEI